MNWKSPPADPGKVWIGKSMELQIMLLCNWNCHACFIGYTDIKMAGTGVKKISDVVEGDMVLSYDEHSHEFVERRVLRTMARQTSEMFRLKTDGWRKTFVTGDHPLLVKDKGWIQVKDLQIGDVILHLSTAEMKKLNNPMKRPDVATKMGAGRRGIPVMKTEEHKKKSAAAASRRMLTNNPMKDPAVAIKGFLARKDRGKLEKSEELVLEAGQKVGIIFVGGGDLVVGFKVPDFILAGTKKLVETWDVGASEYFGRDQAWMDARRAIFAAEGYETLFLPVNPKERFWADEVARAEAALAEYACNGETVTSIELISAETNPKAWTRLAGTKKGLATVYNLEVEGTHTYVANGLIAHNCDQFSNLPGISWVKRATMSVEQIVAFCREMRDKNAYLGRIRLVGGEPSLHPKLPVIVGTLNSLVGTGHVGVLEVVTNGSHPEKLEPVRQFIGKVRVSDEKDKQRSHVANLSATPVSLGYEGRMCSAPWHCGFSLNYYGYFPCSSGAGIARLRDWMRWQRLELPMPRYSIDTIRATWPDLQVLCNHCYHGLRDEDKVRCGTGQQPGQYGLNVPNQDTWENLAPWLNGKQPDWKIYGSEHD